MQVREQKIYKPYLYPKIIFFIFCLLFPLLLMSFNSCLTHPVFSALISSAWLNHCSVLTVGSFLISTLFHKCLFPVTFSLFSSHCFSKISYPFLCYCSYFFLRESVFCHKMLELGCNVIKLFHIILVVCSIYIYIYIYHSLYNLIEFRTDYIFCLISVSVFSSKYFTSQINKYIWYWDYNINFYLLLMLLILQVFLFFLVPYSPLFFLVGAFLITLLCNKTLMNS